MSATRRIARAGLVAWGLLLMGCATGGRQPLAYWHVQSVHNSSEVKVRSWIPVSELPGFDPRHPTQADQAENACLRDTSLHHRFASAAGTVALVVACMQAKGWKVQEDLLTIND